LASRAKNIFCADNRSPTIEGLHFLALNSVLDKLVHNLRSNLNCAKYHSLDLRDVRIENK
jgi:hypothetical protein